MHHVPAKNADISCITVSKMHLTKTFDSVHDIVLWRTWTTVQIDVSNCQPQVSCKGPEGALVMKVFCFHVVHKVGTGYPWWPNVELHWPGIGPGSPAWQARILPLNHQCAHAEGILPPQGRGPLISEEAFALTGAETLQVVCLTDCPLSLT